MPVYEFECTSCGHKFDQLCKIGEDNNLTCPACGTKSVTKIISLSSFHLKGSGWYKTDYAKKDSE